VCDFELANDVQSLPTWRLGARVKGLLG